MNNGLGIIICWGIVIIILLIIFVPVVTIKVKLPSENKEFDIEKFRKQ